MRGEFRASAAMLMAYSPCRREISSKGAGPTSRSLASRSDREPPVSQATILHSRRHGSTSIRIVAVGALSQPSMRIQRGLTHFGHCANPAGRNR